MQDIKNLKARISKELHPKCFRRTPRRVLLVIQLVSVISAGSLTVVFFPMPELAAFAIAVFIGLLYGSLFFLGHEISHGAIVRSRQVKTSLLYITFFIFCLSPHFWHIWHVRVHHGFTNMAGIDPDNYGTLDEHSRYPSTRFVLKFAPGCGHFLSTLYLLIWFPIHSQGVLWVQSRRTPVFMSLKRGRAALDSAAMLAVWIIVDFAVGGHAALYINVIPFIVANFVIMSYISTNHLLCPLTDHTDPLTSSMSVKSCKLFDLLFLNFSHHVEHHLFPAMSSCYAPLVRKSLERHAKDRYFAPNHWRALLLVFQTPKLYKTNTTLVDPNDRRLVEIASIWSLLRGKGGEICMKSELEDS